MSLLARVNLGGYQGMSRVVAADINKSRRLGSHDAIRRIRESWNLTLTSTGSSDPIPLGRGTREQRDRGSEYPSTRDSSILIHLLLGPFSTLDTLGLGTRFPSKRKSMKIILIFLKLPHHCDKWIYFNFRTTRNIISKSFHHSWDLIVRFNFRILNEKKKIVV